MAEAVVDEKSGDKPRRGVGKALLVGVLGAALSGGAAFFAAYSGILDGGGKSAGHEEKDYAFVPLETVTVSLGPEANAEVLRFKASLEVAKSDVADVEALTPRILDVLNGYLRAVDEEELRDPGSLDFLRAQMLRRIQIVTGDGKVRDLLVIEFILN